MFMLRFLVLSFLVGFGYSMGQTPSNQLNAFGSLMVFAFFIATPMLYLLPTYEAWNNEQPNITSIALINLFLGWTVLGWVVALVWAFKKAEPVLIAAAAQAAEPSEFANTKPQRLTKRCQFCAEDVLAEAIKCKHCGSDLRASA